MNDLNWIENNTTLIKRGRGGEFSIAVHRVLHYDVKEKIALTLYILT